MATSNVAEAVRWEGTKIGDGTHMALPRTASGSSRRRFCRIYPERDRWVLRVDPTGWGLSATTKSFATLNAAIAYALAHDYSYRVFHLQGGEAHWTPASAQRHGPMGELVEAARGRPT
jgi:hypothetical protein